MQGSKFDKSAILNYFNPRRFRKSKSWKRGMHWIAVTSLSYNCLNMQLLLGQIWFYFIIIQEYYTMGILGTEFHTEQWFWTLTPWHTDVSWMVCRSVFGVSFPACWGKDYNFLRIFMVQPSMGGVLSLTMKSMWDTLSCSVSKLCFRPGRPWKICFFLSFSMLWV